MGKPEQSQKEEEADNKGDYDEGRRNFLKVAMGTSAILAFAGVGTVLKSIANPALPGTTSTSFPRVKVGNLDSLRVNEPVIFNYPLDNEPNVLVKLGQRANSGVGPDGDIVAFSLYCQHLGIVYGFQPTGSSPDCNKLFTAQGPVGYCCAHGSVYDFLQNAKVLAGPSLRPVPQVILQVDSSTNDIFAVGMTPPAIFGHNTGSNDVTSDLQGGSPVG